MSGSHTSKGRLAGSNVVSSPDPVIFHQSTSLSFPGGISKSSEPSPAAVEVLADCVSEIMSHDCHPRRCIAPGPGCGWYRMNMNVRRQEKQNMVVTGANTALRKRPTLAMVGIAMVARTKTVTRLYTHAAMRARLQVTQFHNRDNKQT